MTLTSIRGTIVNILTKTNTTTSAYDISSGLSKRVQAVIAGYSKEPIPNINFPVVFVELLSKSETQKCLGRTAARDVTMNFRIRCITDYGYGQFTGRRVGDIEMLTLAGNVEKMFRNNIKLSSTVEWAFITDSQYAIEEYNGTYNSIADLSLQVFKII